jgi:hypothetical protein
LIPKTFPQYFLPVDLPPFGSFLVLDAEVFEKEDYVWVTRRRIVILEDLAAESAVEEEWMGDKESLSPRRNLAL